MSLKLFYQTFYQHEQLYRLPGESFASVAFRAIEPVPVQEPTAVAVSVDEPDEVELIDKPTEVVLLPVLPVPQRSEPPTTPVISPKIRQKVLLLADEALEPSSLLFLEKILNAVNLDITGVDLLNLHGAGDIDFAAVLRDKHIHHFITFGVPFERVGLDIMMDRYQPVRFEGITFLIADALPVIEANQTLKRSLWSALKRVFQHG